MAGIRDNESPCPTGFVATFCSFNLVETAVKCCSCCCVHFIFEFCLCCDLAHSQPFTEQFKGNKALKMSKTKGKKLHPLLSIPLSSQLSRRSCIRAASLRQIPLGVSVFPSIAPIQVTNKRHHPNCLGSGREHVSFPHTQESGSL